MNIHRSKGGKRSWMSLFTSSENFTIRLSEMLLETGGRMTWTFLGGKHSIKIYLPPSSNAGSWEIFFFNEAFLWQTLLYFWHLKVSLIQGKSKYRYLLTYGVRRSKKIAHGEGRRRGFSFSPGMQITWLNLYSIYFSVLCALLSNEIKKLLHC